ncbi:aminoglycoside phosphotransferase family protein [Micromonospora sp. NPDC049903]|uniref:aminoglycoside phosphotransferase family protein n=1 Tax=Micromonospora sp. NPDC049903 TaxID=3364276 RepID=UPI00378D4703
MQADAVIAIDEAERIAHATGQRVVDAVRVRRGYSNNRRWLARLDDGRTVFVKHADDEPGAIWLRREHAVYRQLHAPFMPELLGWYDDGELPVLVLEDLSDSTWPPPWSPEQLRAVRDTLGDLAARPAIDGLVPASHTQYGQGGWPEIARDPAQFLALRVCSPQWLDKCLPTILDAADFTGMDGDSVTHLDVRSDNLCFRGSQPVLFDWNHAALGNPQFDLAFWLPSLTLEGGPQPAEVLTEPDPRVVTLVTGFFASRAGLPFLPKLPLVREFQLRQLQVALPWMTAVLGLPPAESVD